MSEPGDADDPGEPPVRPHMFRSLRERNFAIFFSGQLVSQTGTWFYNLAISLIIVELTGSATALALVTVAQFLPMFLLAPLAGRLADAWPPRRILMVGSGLATLTTLALAYVLTQPDPNLVLVYGLIFITGCTQAFDRVTANTFVYELVGPVLLQNGVVLTTLTLSIARSFGPGLAGLTFAFVGPGACLIINAVSFALAFLALAFIDPNRLVPRPRSESDTGSLRSAIAAAVRDLPLRTILIVNVIVTLAVLSLQVVLTSIVSFEFAGDATALGAAHALNAIGAIVGGLLVTRLRIVRASTLILACSVFAVCIGVNAAAPTLLLFLAAAPILGIGIGFYQGVLNSAAQAATPPWALGRTLSLLTVGNLGLAPLGAILTGALIDLTSGRTALGVGAALTAFAAVFVWFALRRHRPHANTTLES